MNSYLPPNNATGNVSINPTINPGVRPVFEGNNPNSVPVRPIRMHQMQPNNQQQYPQQYQQHQQQSGFHRPQNQPMHPPPQQNTIPNHLQQQQMSMNRNAMLQQQPLQQQQQQLLLQQQQQEQQNNRFQNHSQQQQFHQEKTGTFLREDPTKFLTEQKANPPNRTNVPNQYNQNGETLSEGQRTQITPKAQYPDSRQSIKPELSGGNQSSGGIINQTLSSNYKKMEDLKLESNRMQQNHQNEIFDKGKSQFKRENPAKLPDLNKNSVNTVHTPAKPQMQESVDVQNATKFINRKPESLNSESIHSSESEPESKQSVENDEKNSSSSRETMGKKIKKTKQKDDKGNVIDHNITSGTVRKNINFFEKNDTAKTPLTPGTTSIKKPEKDTKTPSNVVKSEFYTDAYESGVDESPIIFSNLGTIHDAPRKVAKISRRIFKTHSKKHKTDKNPKFKLYSKFSPSGGKPPKNKTFGSNEELLAFFDNPKSWRKFIRYGKSGSGQNATKDKVAYKPTTNGDFTPKRTPSKLPAPTKLNQPTSPARSPVKSPGTPGAKTLPKTPESPAPATPLIKKVPMNKIQVGAAPSPNLKVVKSKVGSLVNTTHKPGGGNVKIETHKIDLSKAQPRIEAKNDQYKPSGGDKKIAQVKLQWSAKSKVGSLENATYKPGGGDKKIESVKLDFKEKAKSKVGSKDNVKHVPGGGNIKIENQKLEFKAQSKVGSLDNVKHKPGGGDIKIFDDKTYLRQVSGNCSEGRASGTQRSRDASATRKLEIKSAPGTPGRKTTVKIKKIITLQSFEQTPKVEKVTEVTVTSQTVKKENKVMESPLKQQVTLTYSKILSSKNDGEKEIPVEKVPANDYAPILRPNLSKKEAFDYSEIEKQNNENKNKYTEGNTFHDRNGQNKPLQRQIPISPGLPEGKSHLGDDSGMSKFMKDEMATQERIGEMWREINTVEKKPTLSSNRMNEEQSRDTSQSFFLENGKSGINPLQPPKSINSDFQYPKFPQNLSPNQNQFPSQTGFSSHVQNK